VGQIDSEEGETQFVDSDFIYTQLLQALALRLKIIWEVGSCFFDNFGNAWQCWQCLAMLAI